MASAGVEDVGLGERPSCRVALVAEQKALVIVSAHKFVTTRTGHRMGFCSESPEIGEETMG